MNDVLVPKETQTPTIVKTGWFEIFDNFMFGLVVFGLIASTTDSIQQIKSQPPLYLMPEVLSCYAF